MTLTGDPTLLAFQHVANHFAPPAARPQWDTPGGLARALDPRTVRTPALDLIDTELVAAYNTPDSRLIISMPPQEGKSQRASRRFPTWALAQNPDLRIVMASYSDRVARRFSRAVRDDINAYGHLLGGLRVREDLAAQSEWEIAGHEGGMYAVGIGGSLTSRPADGMVIDDPIKGRQQADSEVERENVWDFWLEVAATRLAPGAFVIVILTRWHEDDLAGRLLAAEDGHLWRVVNIPAQADHRPEQGETDPLGRQPGEFLQSARGRTVEQWEAIKTRSAGRTWTSLYQGRPAPAEGTLFKRDDWQRYSAPMWIVREDGSRIVPGVAEGIELVQSWDMAFKDLDSSDYVVGQVWLRRGVEVFLLDQIRGRLSFTGTCDAVATLSARWPQAVAKYIEDKANGPAVISSLRKRIGGLIALQPEGSKQARAAAVSPFVEAGNVYLPDPELAPWIGEFIDEHAAFPTGRNDDQVDGTSQALTRLLLDPLMAGQILDAGDLDSALDDYTIGADY